MHLSIRLLRCSVQKRYSSAAAAPLRHRGVIRSNGWAKVGPTLRVVEVCRGLSVEAIGSALAVGTPALTAAASRRKLVGGPPFRVSAEPPRLLRIYPHV